MIGTAGVAPSPLISQLGLGTDHGRLVVDDRLQSREHEHIFALGDAAAVPNLTHPGKLAAQTAQNAQRQGLVAARNVAAFTRARQGAALRAPHLGFVVDLTGRNAVATPLGLPLTGWAAKLVDRLYHLRVLPSGRMRVLTDWINGLVAGRPIVRLELIDPADATINAEAHDPASTPRLDGLQRGGSRTQDEPASPAELGRGDHPQLHDLHRSSMAVTPHRQTAGEFSANE